MEDSIEMPLPLTSTPICEKRPLIRRDTPYPRPSLNKLSPIKEAVDSERPRFICRENDLPPRKKSYQPTQFIAPKPKRVHCVPRKANCTTKPLPAHTRRIVQRREEQQPSRQPTQRRQEIQPSPSFIFEKSKTPLPFKYQKQCAFKYVNRKFLKERQEQERQQQQNPAMEVNDDIPGFLQATERYDTSADIAAEDNSCSNRNVSVLGCARKLVAAMPNLVEEERSLGRFSFPVFETRNAPPEQQINDEINKASGNEAEEVPHTAQYFTDELGAHMNESFSPTLIERNCRAQCNRTGDEMFSSEIDTRLYLVPLEKPSHPAVYFFTVTTENTRSVQRVVVQ